MNKIVVLFFVIALVFAFSGCGDSEDYQYVDNVSTISSSDFLNDDGSSKEQNNYSSKSTTNNTSINGTPTTSTETSKLTTSDKDNKTSSKPSNTTSTPTTSKPTTSRPSSTSSTPSHTHNFSNATCTEPQKCSCGATSGSALGHTYNEATCTKAETCTRCGVTNGGMLGHNYTKKGNCTRCNVFSDEIVTSLFEKMSSAFFLSDPFEFDNTSEISPTSAALYILCAPDMYTGLKTDIIKSYTEGLDSIIEISPKYLNERAEKLFGRTFDFSKAHGTAMGLSVQYLENDGIIQARYFGGWGSAEIFRCFSHSKVDDCTYIIVVDDVVRMSETEANGQEGVNWYYSGEKLLDGTKEVCQIEGRYNLTLKYVDDCWRYVSFVKLDR